MPTVELRSTSDHLGRAIKGLSSNIALITRRVSGERTVIVLGFIRDSNSSNAARVLPGTNAKEDNPKAHGTKRLNALLSAPYLSDRFSFLTRFLFDKGSDLLARVRLNLTTACFLREGWRVRLLQ